MTYYSYVRSIISGVEKPPTTEWEENPPDHGYIELKSDRGGIYSLSIGSDPGGVL